MSSPAQQAVPQSRFARVSQVLMASCLGVMAVAVFINVVLRYGFGSGVAASEELSRLLFVWMVFIGAAAAYPAGEHMAFTSLAGLLAKRPVAFGLLTAVIRSTRRSTSVERRGMRVASSATLIAGASGNASVLPSVRTPG